MCFVVLLLDEFPLFRADVIEALRQPLESGEVTIARGEESSTFPARGIVVLAANPCRCGNYHPDPAYDDCRCEEVERRRYRARFTGPIADRIDIFRRVLPVRQHERHDALAPDPESSATVRARVERARARQVERYAGRSWRLNGQAPGPLLLGEWPLTPSATRRLDDQMYAGRLSRRGATRVHRLAWTIADLRGSRPGDEELDLALRLRTGEPLPAAAHRRAG